MNDLQIEKELAEIKGELKKISKNTHGSVWRSFFTGTLSGLGSIVGVAIALSIIAWILNSVGVIPAFKNEVSRINQTLDLLQKNR